METRLGHLGTVWALDEPTLSTLRGLTLVSDGAGGIVVQAIAGPLPGFQVTEWHLGEDISLVSSALFPGDGLAGTTPTIESLSTQDGQNISVMLGDGTGMAKLLSAGAPGTLAAAAVASGADARTWPDVTALVLSRQGGEVFAFTLSTGQAQPDVWHVTEENGFVRVPSSRTAPATGGHSGAAPSSLAITGSHLAVAGTADTPITLYRIAPDGRLIPEGHAAMAENPGLAGAIVLAAGVAGDNAHVIAGAAQSDTLSVWAIESDGALRLTDHVLDTRDSRFQGVSQLEAVTRDGNTWIAAGGADSGVSLFRLLPNGRLVQVARLADALDWSLDGLAALDLMMDEAGVLHLVTAGLRDGGISHFSFAPATLVMGTASNDRLTGGDTPDILFDGAGEDTLTTGAGADIFVLDADGQTDLITDFDPAEDRLDMSNWPFFRGPHQLVIEPRADGVELLFNGSLGQERLILRSVTGVPLQAEFVRAALLPGPDRLLLRDTIARTPEPPADLQLGGSSGADEITGQDGHDTINGLAGSDLLRGEGGNDSIEGKEGFDTIFGGPGDDTLLGQDGWDSLIGGTGDDLLFGNNGSDDLFGDAGNDTLFGGIGTDRLLGGGGDDSLVGMPGADVLEGGVGADHLLGNAGPDTLIGGNGDDHLEGGLNSDLLEGGAGNDLLEGGNGFDTLLGGAGNDTLRGNAGQDWLEGGGGTDLLDGGIGADTFVFRGGDVSILRFQKRADTLLLDAALFDGQPPDLAEVMATAVVIGDDTLIDFGARGSLTVHGLTDISQIATAIDWL